MKSTLSLLFTLTLLSALTICTGGCVLFLAGAAGGAGYAAMHGAHADFTPYVGKQGVWPQSPGSIVETKYTVPIYYGWPDKPYTVLGVITAKGNHPAAVARYAKSLGADALIYRASLTSNAGTYTTPGHATSITSGNYAYGQYSGFTTTTYNPGVSVPLTATVTTYTVIQWKDPLQAKVDILRNTLDWANAHPNGGTYGEGQDTNYFSAQQVQDLKNSLQEQLDDLVSPLNPSKAQAEVDALRSELDWLNAHPDGGIYGEGQNAISFNAGDIQGAKAESQQQLDDLLSRLNQFAKTNASANSVTSLPVFAQTPQTNASETLNSETLKSFATDADKGDCLSQVILAGIYSEGIGGVQKDSATAAYWYLRAAKQGDYESQFSMGEMYEKGEGVMQDFVEAYKWFNIAAVAPDIDWNAATNLLKSKGVDVDIETLKKSRVPVAEKAKAARDQLARQMTAEQIAEGQRRSAAFVPRIETPSSQPQ